MQLQGRSCSTCAAGVSVAKRVKIIVEGRTFLFLYKLTSFIFKQTDVSYTQGKPSRKATPGAGKIKNGVPPENLNKKQHPVLKN